MLRLLVVLIAVQVIGGSFVGMPCTENAQCRTVPTMCLAVCVDNKCECGVGFYGSEGSIYCNKVKIGSPCDTDDFCRTRVRDSICDPDFHVCVCPANYGEVWTPATDKTFCAERSAGAVCGTCNDTGGTCYFDGTSVRCGCPCPFGYSGHPITTGCDIKLAYTGQTCRADGSIRCIDVNAECTHDGSLTTSFTCTCKTGYVAVPVSGSIGEYTCVRRISNDVDPEHCGTCIANGGQCYDRDNDDHMDGCVCPYGTSSPSANPDDACSIRHFEVTCDTHSITFCVDGQESFNSLSAYWESMHAEHYGDFLDCHLKVVSTGRYCLTVTYSPNAENCGLLVTESEYTTSYSLWIILQESGLMASTDICVYAYCIYHKKAHTATGVIDVTKKKLTASEGVSVRPEIDMSIQNKFREDVEYVGARLGDLVRLIIDVTDNKNVYTNLRAEVCVISNMLSLDHPHVESEVFILDACPVENALMGNPPPIFVDDPDNSLRIITNFFHMPKLSTDVVFFQCCVKVCIRAEDCAPKDCNSRRRKRAIGMSPKEALLAESHEPNVMLKSIAVSIKDGEHVAMEHKSDTIEDELMEDLERLESTIQDSSKQTILPVAGIVGGIVFLVVVVALVGLALNSISKRNQVVISKESKIVA